MKRVGSQRYREEKKNLLYMFLIHSLSVEQIASIYGSVYDRAASTVIISANLW
jgi:hypothetical protein